jgi:hypothetical protein
MMLTLRALVGALFACGLFAGCKTLEAQAAKDPMKCERDPSCARRFEKSGDCATQCADDSECMKRCEYIRGGVDRAP